LRAARIRGRLDLDNLVTTLKLTLLDCLLDEGITAQAAHLPGLSLRRCRLMSTAREFWFWCTFRDRLVSVSPWG
ncbi:MAG: hypothetical protein LC749_11325, partial [Actinobacteria bacterium]|nr:hypothetical protein [Actinomycetota bacterium]